MRRMEDLSPLPKPSTAEEREAYRQTRERMEKVQYFVDECNALGLRPTEPHPKAKALEEAIKRIALGPMPSPRPRPKTSDPIAASLERLEGDLKTLKGMGLL